MTQRNLRPEDLHVVDVRLRLWHLDNGSTDRPRVVILHGMRDVARSLLPLAEVLADQFDVTLLDQRGHGASDYPGAYSMEYFYYDLYQVITHLQGNADAPVALVGHSLGGQICARFSGLFPELVRALVLIEGLGPPDPNWPAEPADESFDIDRYRQTLLDRLSISAAMRPLPSVAFAAQRLRVNNPRMSAAQAEFTARIATREVVSADGNKELHWAFDPRVASAFVGFSMADSQRLWQANRAPVLTITGDLAHEYWRSALPAPNYSGEFQPGEYAQRIAHFRNIEHERFAGSGHMVHFDEPDRLARSVRAFLQRTLPANRQT